MRKYKLTDETISIVRDGKKITLYQIESLRDFAVVKAGDKGGFIEKESNLSQDGNCWVYGSAKVYDNAWIYGNAEVYGSAEVYDNAEVSGSAKVYDNAWIYGDTELST